MNVMKITSQVGDISGFPKNLLLQVYKKIFYYFFRFVAKEEISGTTQIKSSVQRGIRTKVQEQYPNIQPYIDEILPKKESIVLIKW